MRRVLVSAVGVATAIFGLSRPADASLILTLSDVTNGASLTCNNSAAACGAPFTSGINDVFVFTPGAPQTLGQFSYQFIGALDNIPGGPGSAPATLTISELMIRNTGATAATFTIDFTGIGFSLPAGTPMDIVSSASISTFSNPVPTSTFTMQAGGAETGTPPLLGVCTMNLPGPGGSPNSDNCDGPAMSFTRVDPTGTFNLRQVLTLNLAAGAQVTGGANLSAADPPAVPEPASLLLLGSGLVVVGRRLRKRSAKA